MFRVILCVQFYRLMQLIFSTSLKGIIRKECQSFTNHGHDKTPPTVFNPLSLWLTLPRDMGVSHTLLPHSITGAILACLWFAQGSKKSKQQSHSYVPVVCTGFAQGSKKLKQQSRSMMFRVILCVQFYRLTQLIFSTLLNEGKNLTSMSASGQAYESLSWRCATEGC